MAFSSKVFIGKPNVGITGTHASGRGEHAATRYDARVSRSDRQSSWTADAMNTITSGDGARAHLALMIPLVKISEQAAVAVSGRVHYTAALAGGSGVTLHRLQSCLEARKIQ